MQHRQLALLEYDEHHPTSGEDVKVSELVQGPCPEQQFLNETCDLRDNHPGAGECYHTIRQDTSQEKLSEVNVEAGSYEYQQNEEPHVDANVKVLPQDLEQNYKLMPQNDVVADSISTAIASTKDPTTFDGLKGETMRRAASFHSSSSNGTKFFQSRWQYCQPGRVSDHEVDAIDQTKHVRRDEIKCEPQEQLEVEDVKSVSSTCSVQARCLTLRQSLSYRQEHTQDGICTITSSEFLYSSNITFQELSRIRDLRLQGISLTSLNGTFLMSLPHLTALDISHNAISSLCAIASDVSSSSVSSQAASGLPDTLIQLNASHNRIAKLVGLQGCFQLKKLNVSHNQLKSCCGIEHLQSLRVLDLSNNILSSNMTWRLLSCNHNLEDLHIHDNPVSIDAKQYRAILKSMLKELRVLDGIPLPRVKKTTHSPPKQKAKTLTAQQQMARDKARFEAWQKTLDQRRNAAVANHAKLQNRIVGHGIRLSNSELQHTIDRLMVPLEKERYGDGAISTPTRKLAYPMRSASNHHRALSQRIHSASSLLTSPSRRYPHPSYAKLMSPLSDHHADSSLYSFRKVISGTDAGNDAAFGKANPQRDVESINNQFTCELTTHLQSELASPSSPREFSNVDTGAVTSTILSESAGETYQTLSWTDGRLEQAEVALIDPEHSSKSEINDIDERDEHHNNSLNRHNDHDEDGEMVFLSGSNFSEFCTMSISDNDEDDELIKDETPQTSMAVLSTTTNDCLFQQSSGKICDGSQSHHFPKSNLEDEAQHGHGLIIVRNLPQDMSRTRADTM